MQIHIDWGKFSPAYKGKHSLDLLIPGKSLPSEAATIVLNPVSELGSGRCGTVVVLSRTGFPELPRLVAKMMGTEVNNQHQHPQQQLHPNQIEDAARNEARMYAAITELQGTVVPYYYGLWTDPQNGMLIALMSFAGLSLGNGLASPAPLLAPYRSVPNFQCCFLSLFLTCRRPIIAAYNSLHARGVLHVDIAPRHICRRGTSIMLVDFEGSSDSDVLESDVADERRTVECMLGSAQQAHEAVAQASTNAM